jgi:hypothetical protein
LGILWEKSFWAFFFITVLFGGGAAFMTGRAIASAWKPFREAALYMILLAAAVRFLHWGLFSGATLASWRAAQGSLFSLHYYIADLTILLLLAALGFRLHRTRQMTRQYHWLYEKTSPLTWRQRADATFEPQSQRSS